MNILIVTTNGITREFVSWPERVQARGLVKNGHSVQAFTYLGKQSWNSLAEEIIDGVLVKRLRRRQWLSWDLLQAFLSGPRPDVVHLFHLSNQLNFQTILLCKLRRIPTVLGPLGIFHDPYLVDDRDRPFDTPPKYDQLILTLSGLVKALSKNFKLKMYLKNYLMHAPLRLADGFVALSHHERDELIKLGVPADQITVIACSVDEEWLDGIEAPVKKLAEPQIFYLGQFKYRKGFDLLAKAIPMVVEKFPGARFVFAGHSPIHQKVLLDIAETGGVTAHLTLLDNISEAQKAELFLGSTLLACPSRYEGFGIPLIEAMSAGCPIVTTDIPVINEIVKDNETGLFFKLEDHVGLAQAINTLLADLALQQKLSDGGRRAVTRFHTTQIVKELEQTYCRLIDRPKGFFKKAGR